MDKFRRSIKTRMYTGVVIILICAALIILDQVGFFDNSEFFRKYENISAFQLGFLVGISLVALFNMFRLRKIVKNPTELQKLYNKENDERLALIRQKSGMPIIMITSGIMILAAVVAGYINETVFFTLIAAAMAQIVISLAVKVYYMRKI